jgi:hypothetical protein
VTAAAMAHRHATVLVASAGTIDGRQQAFFGRLVGQRRKIGHLHKALARSSRI